MQTNLFKLIVVAAALASGLFCAWIFIHQLNIESKKKHSTHNEKRKYIQNKSNGGSLSSQVSNSTHYEDTKCDTK